MSMRDATEDLGHAWTVGDRAATQEVPTSTEANERPVAPVDCSSEHQPRNESAECLPPPVAPGKSVEVFYDGDCPLCVREINMLRWLDRRRRIQFTDIADAEFEPSRYGKSMATLMAEIHGRLPDGEWITGVEVFRQLYDAVGCGLGVKLSRLPGVRQGLDAGYRVFAKYRLPLTGRSCRADSDGNCQVG